MSFDMGTSIQGAGMGAKSGGSLGGPYGAIAGAVVGGIYGGIVGGKAKKKDKELKKQQELYFAEIMKQIKRYGEMAGVQDKLYNESFLPLEKLLGEQAMSGKFYAPDDVRQDYMDEASARVMSSFKKFRDMSDREDMAAGRDPTDASGAMRKQKQYSDAMKQEAGSMTRAARQADEDVTGRRFQTQKIGRQALDAADTFMQRSVMGNYGAWNKVQGDREANQEDLKSKMSFLDVGGGMGGIGGGGGSGGVGDMVPLGSGGGKAGEPSKRAFLFAEGGPVGTFGSNQESGMGGAVTGPGGPVDDQIQSEVPSGAYVIPADVVETLGVDFFDKIETQNSTKSGATGVQSRVNARLSSGEYVISPETVQRKGRKFFDDLVAKYHKPAAEQSEQYQEQNQGVQPGEAEQQFAEGGSPVVVPGNENSGITGYATGVNAGQVDAATQGQAAQQAPYVDPAMDEFKNLQEKFDAEKQGGAPLTMDEMLRLNELKDMYAEVSKADGGVLPGYDDGGYLSGNMGQGSTGQYTSAGGGDQYNWNVTPEQQQAGWSVETPGVGNNDITPTYGSRAPQAVWAGSQNPGNATADQGLTDPNAEIYNAGAQRQKMAKAMDPRGSNVDYFVGIASEANRAKGIKAAYDAAKPSEIGIFSNKGGVLEDRIAQHKINKERRLAEAQRSRDMAEWQAQNPANRTHDVGVGGPTIQHRSLDVSRADGGEVKDNSGRYEKITETKPDGTLKVHEKWAGPPGMPQHSSTDYNKKPYGSFSGGPDSDTDEAAEAEANPPKKPKLDIPMRGSPKNTVGGTSRADGGKVGKVMGEYKHGTLHSGSKSGPVVTNRKQAIAIAMSEAGKSKKKTRRGGRKHKKYADGGVSGKFGDGGPAKYSKEWYKEHGIRPSAGDKGPAPKAVEGQYGKIAGKVDNSGATEGYGAWYGKHAGAKKPKDK